MGYVPGFKHDIFISYAHGDDAPALTPDGSGWVAHFTKRLGEEVRLHLGTAPSIWFDKRNLDSFVDFDKEIHDHLDAALLVVIATPSYSRSQYCTQERAQFRQFVAEKHASKFQAGALANAQFMLKAVALTNPREAHRKEDLATLNDLMFCEGEGFESRRFALESRQFDDAMQRMQAQVCGLLYKMRNRCSPVFLWPRVPNRISGLEKVREDLANELSDAEYRVIPELAEEPDAELEDSALSIFLLGPVHDRETEQLIGLARGRNKPWVVWQSAIAAKTDDFAQRKLINELINDPSHYKTILDHNSSLKGEVLQILRPTASVVSSTNGKRIYVVYDDRIAEDMGKANWVVNSIPEEFDVELAERGELSAHAGKLKSSEGVLLVWGKAGFEWYADEFRKVNVHARRALSRGICFFDPKQEIKEGELAYLGTMPNLHVIRAFEHFDPESLRPFLDGLRQRAQVAA